MQIQEVELSRRGHHCRHTAVVGEGLNIFHTYMAYIQDMIEGAGPQEGGRSYSGSTTTRSWGGTEEVKQGLHRAPPERWRR